MTGKDCILAPWRMLEMQSTACRMSFCCCCARFVLACCLWSVCSYALEFLHLMSSAKRLCRWCERWGTMEERRNHGGKLRQLYPYMTHFYAFTYQRLLEREKNREWDANHLPGCRL